MRKILLGTLVLCPLLGVVKADVGKADVDKRLLLDERLIAETDNAALRVGTVEKNPANPLFGEEYGWEARFDNMYPSVTYDEQEEIYKVWYFTYTYDPTNDAIPPEQRHEKPWGPMFKKLRKANGGLDPRTDGVCYAYSKDGLHWTKPLLAECPWKGKPSNVVMHPAHGATVFKDPHEKDPKRRYKMFGSENINHNRDLMFVSFSEDGIHWGKKIRCPEIRAYGDTYNNAFWDPRTQQYIGITRMHSWPQPSQRLVVRTVSKDFVKWTPNREVYRGTYKKQTYSMPTVYYAGIYIGLPAILDLRKDGIHTELAWSPDTIHWHRIDEGTPLLTAGPKGSYDCGIAHVGRPIIRPHRIELYYGGGDGIHFGWRKGSLCLATLRVDGFAGYEPIDKAKAASVTLKPQRLGNKLGVTADAQGGVLRVLVLDADGNTVLKSKPIDRDITDQPVEWEKGRLAELEEHPYTLRFELKRAKVYAYTL